MTNTYNIIATKDAAETAGHILLPVSRTDGKKGKSGICIQVPEVSDSVLTLVFNHQIGKAFFTDAIDGIRSKIASELHKKQNPITSDKLGIDGILAAMKAETESQRMTREVIEVWFVADLQTLLTNAVKAKIPTLSSDKLDKIMKSYVTDFQTLASRNPTMSAEIKTKLTKAIALLPDDYESIMGEKVITALNDITTDIGDCL